MTVEQIGLLANILQQKQSEKISNKDLFVELVSALQAFEDFNNPRKNDGSGKRPN